MVKRYTEKAAKALLKKGYADKASITRTLPDSCGYVLVTFNCFPAHNAPFMGCYIE